MKSRTKPFSSEKSANDFSKIVSGKVTTQEKIVHVHYKSDGQYRGNKSEQNDHTDFDSDINGNGTNWHDSSDI